MARVQKQKSAVRTGAGGLKSSPQIKWQHVLGIVLVVALVGGFFVYKSFAATNSISAGGMTGGYDTSGKGVSSRILNSSNSTLVASGLASPSRMHQACVTYIGGAGARKLNLTYTIGGKQRGSNSLTINGGGSGELCALVNVGGVGTLMVQQSGSGETYIDRAFIR